MDGGWRDGGTEGQTDRQAIPGPNLDTQICVEVFVQFYSSTI